MKKKRILKDPETGEIVGATRTPFSRSAKEMNERIFAEKFEKSRLERESKPPVSKNTSLLLLVILAVLAVVAYSMWQGKANTEEPSKTTPVSP